MRSKVVRKQFLLRTAIDAFSAAYRAHSFLIYLTPLLRYA